MRDEASPDRQGFALALALAAMFASSPAGCSGPGGEALPRKAISGTVNFAGSPLKSGQIQFQPTSGDAVTAGAAGIEAGAYAISEAEGLVPGSYKVTITSAAAGSSKPAAGVMPGDSAPPPKEPIPSKYNAKSKLTAVVKAAEPNTFTFDLDAK